MLQAALVFIFGLMTFFLTQCALRFILEPIIKIRSNIAYITHCMIIHDLAITNSHFDKEASNDLKRCAAVLRSSVAEALFYQRIRRITLLNLPSRWNAEQCCLLLALIAINIDLNEINQEENEVHRQENSYYRNSIGKILKIPARHTSMTEDDYRKFLKDIL